jgi:hypothetical protein
MTMKENYNNVRGCLEWVAGSGEYFSYHKSARDSALARFTCKSSLSIARMPIAR